MSNSQCKNQKETIKLGIQKEKNKIIGSFENKKNKLNQKIFFSAK